MAEKRAKSSRSTKARAPRPAAKKSAPRKSTPGKSNPTVAKKTPGKKVKQVVGTIARKPKPAGGLITVIENALDDIKAVNVRVLDVRNLTDIADTLVIASGNSDRHVRSIADRVVEFAKKSGHRPSPRPVMPPSGEQITPPLAS